MPEIEKPGRTFKASQIISDISNIEKPMLKIETEDGPVVVRMERSVLEAFFHQSEPTV